MSADVAIQMMVKHLHEQHRQTPARIAESLELDISYVLKALGQRDDPRVDAKTRPTNEEMVAAKESRRAQETALGLPSVRSIRRDIQTREVQRRTQHSGPQRR